MIPRLIWEAPGKRIFVLVLETGEEARSAIAAFAGQCHLGRASVSALGGFARATLGRFDLRAGTFQPIEIAEASETLSLVGEIEPCEDGALAVHLHAVLQLSCGTVRGGHFLQGVVQPALELTIVEAPGEQGQQVGPPAHGLRLIDSAAQRSVER